MKKPQDGGEAILEAFRKLGIDYIISSPGSEWPPVWEALARQQTNKLDGPGYIHCWHETTAVAMANGYARVTGRPQVVLLHSGEGPLQGSMAIQGAYKSEVPMLICSGESLTFGDDPAIDPGSQWYQAMLNVVGGTNRLVEPFVKWSSRVNSHFALHETVIRAVEIAQRVPKGPTFLDIPVEVMLGEWVPPNRNRKIPTPPKSQPIIEDVKQVAELVIRSENPVIVTENCGRDVDAYKDLVQLAELLSIPVVEASSPIYANFPKDHPLHMGFDLKPFMNQSDLFLLIGSKAPWYPPRSGPANGNVVVIDENPIKTQMVYQTLYADAYLEGDKSATLKLLVEILQSSEAININKVKDRRTHWEAEHEKLHESYRSAAEAARDRTPIDPDWLCTAVSEVIPTDATYIDETISHIAAIRRHVGRGQPQSYFRAIGGLGSGLGQALGAKLAMPQKPVVALIGDGSFLYNPIIPSLGVSKDYQLPILIIVFNNGTYASMKGSHLKFYPQGVAETSGLFHGISIDGPNYAQLVEPFHGYGERVEDPRKLKSALQNALEAVNSGKVALLDVVLSA